MHAKGIITHCGGCNVDYGIVDIELADDGGLLYDTVTHTCGSQHDAQQALDAGELNQSEPANYIMTDPGEYAEEIHADSDEDAILQMIRWAEIDGHPYTGVFELRRYDPEDDGEHVYSHESERKEETD